MSTGDVRARVQSLLAQVGATPCQLELCQLEELCHRVGTWLLRQPIHLQGVDTVALGLPSGLVFQTDDDTVILYDATTTRYHQIGIVLHEVDHLVAGHLVGEDVVDQPAGSVLLPEIGRLQAQRRAWGGASPEEAGRGGCGAYTEPVEQQAECFARRVLELAGRPDDRLASTFGA